MIKFKKRDWIEIVLHIAFWVGVFYTVLSFTEPHIKMHVNHNGAIIDEDISHTLSAHIFLALGFMILLFYSDVYWLLKKALRYKNIFIRVILPIAWFGIVFLANTYVDALLPAQQRQDTMLLPPPLPKGGHRVVNEEIDRVGSPTLHPGDIRARITRHGRTITEIERVDSPTDHPDNIKVSIRRPDSVKIRGVVRPDNIQREVARQQTRAFIFATDGFSNTLFFIFVIVFGLSIAYFFLKEWSRVEKMRSELAAVQLDTEVKFLKSQVNPHFLFNTLNNLFSMAQKNGNDSLADGISKLSGMMRYMIYESNEDNVPLRKEIEYLQNCIVLNKLRYADKEVQVIFNYPEKTEGIFVAPMLFIPFVENAFKHGVSIGQSSQIDISISLSEKKLIFSCANTNYSFIKKMEGEKSGIGLENVKRRLDLVYPGKHKLLIDDGDSEFNVKLEIDIA